jgi:hypothetical protein
MELYIIAGPNGAARQLSRANFSLTMRIARISSMLT